MTAAVVTSPPDFDAPRLADAVERLPPEALDALPFGAIRLDAAGVVRLFGGAEPRLSGLREEVLGRIFLAEIAPLMELGGLRGRIERALTNGRLDIAFEQVGDVDDETRELRVRLQSASGGGCWIFVRREG